MKGSPFRELAFFVLIALFLLIPLWQKQKPAASSSAQSPTSLESLDGMETFGEIRFSHPPTDVQLLLGDQQLFSVQSKTLSVHFDTQLPEAGTFIELRVTWPELEGSPFVEIRLEPEEQQEMILPYWGRPGEQTHRWFIKPESAL